MNRILDTLIGPQSPLLGATRAHLTEQLTPSNWHCKAVPVYDNDDFHYLYIIQQICQRSRQSFYSVAVQHKQHPCVVATFFKLSDALEWIEHWPLTVQEDRSALSTTAAMTSAAVSTTAPTTTCINRVTAEGAMAA
ncbi:MAG: hypothetical protein ACRBBW_09295 [Cellvibrionaceae bacterium]